MGNQFRYKKTCKRGHEFTEDNTINGSDGNRRCRTCRRAASKRYHTQNKEKLIARSKKWAEENPDAMRAADHKWKEENKEQIKEYRREKWWIPYTRKLKREVFTHYGNDKFACVCCGESIIHFLTLDHINGRTQEDKKNPNRRGASLWQHLRARNYPKGYQTLCWNCNSGRAVNKGICPHKENTA